jgi:hypothetical protein
VTDVMTTLYKDPANVFITMKAMIYIADAKWDGKDSCGAPLPAVPRK